MGGGGGRGGASGGGRGRGAGRAWGKNKKKKILIEEQCKRTKFLPGFWRFSQAPGWSLNLSLALIPLMMNSSQAYLKETLNRLSNTPLFVLRTICWISLGAWSMDNVPSLWNNTQNVAQVRTVLLSESIIHTDIWNLFSSGNLSCVNYPSPSFSEVYILGVKSFLELNP